MNDFTPRAQQVLALARKEAERFNHNYVGTEHLLLGLIKLGQGVAVNVLQRVLVQIFKKGRRANPGALGERESLACKIGPKSKLCTRTCRGRVCSLQILCCGMTLNISRARSEQVHGIDSSA